MPRLCCEEASARMAYEDLLKHLRCPADRATLNAFGQVVLVCTQCGNAYPVRDGVPVMLIDEEVQREGIEALEQYKAGTSSDDSQKTDD